MEHKAIGESTSRRTQDSPCLAFKRIQKVNQHHLHKTRDKPIQCSKGTVSMRALHASSLLLGVRTVYQVNRSGPLSHIGCSTTIPNSSAGPSLHRRGMWLKSMHDNLTFLIL
ncbi:hypothetical protein SLA2020_509270 [Shorea laevis]